MGFGLVWNGQIPGITWQVDRALSFDTGGIGPGALYASLIVAASLSALPRRSCTAPGPAHDNMVECSRLPSYCCQYVREHRQSQIELFATNDP